MFNHKIEMVIIMFFVFSKEKIGTYAISIITVILIFCFANLIGLKKEQATETSATSEKLLPIYNVETDKNQISLTINCAWNDNDIDTILDTLKRCHVKITFFMVGDWIDRYPESAKKIYEAGQEIGTHSNTHPHVNHLTYEQNIEELETSNEKIQNISGKNTNLYRVPYGEYNNTVICAAKDKGFYTIQWSLATLDYTGKTGEEMWQRIGNKIKKGDIVLMHNGTQHTADSLEMIINNIKEKGLDIVPVSELIYKDNYKIDVNGTQKLNE